MHPGHCLVDLPIMSHDTISSLQPTCRRYRDSFECCLWPLLDLGYGYYCILLHSPAYGSYNRRPLHNQLLACDIWLFLINFQVINRCHHFSQFISYTVILVLAFCIVFAIIWIKIIVIIIVFSNYGKNQIFHYIQENSNISL